MRRRAGGTAGGGAGRIRPLRLRRAGAVALLAGFAMAAAAHLALHAAAPGPADAWIDAALRRLPLGWSGDDPAALAPGPVLARARARGVLRVGVRSYPRPAPPGAPAPSEPDDLDGAAAARLGAALGVRVEAVGLAPRERSEALRRGRVDVVAAGVVDAVAGSSGIDGVADAATAGGYDPGPGRLVAPRSLALPAGGGLAGLRVCVAEGSGLAAAVERLGGAVLPQRSAIQAVSAFLSGECPALAEDARVADRLLSRPQWRFYRPLPQRLDRDRPAALRLAGGDAASRRYLEAVLHAWRHGGGLDAALDARGANLHFEVTLLEDGALCH